jgi:hypothetical protein
MSRAGSKLFLALIATAALACAGDPAAPLQGDKLTGFSVGQVGDSTPSGVPTGTGAMQVGGTVKGVGVGVDTMISAPNLADVEVKAYKHLGYAGNEVLIGEQVGSLTTDANGWFGYLSLPPGKYAITFTPPANSAFRGIYVTYESHGSAPNNTVASLWGIYLPRK